MTPQIQPYLSFDGLTIEAIEFYQATLGAELIFSMTFRECPDPTPPGMLPEGWEDKIMHASFRIGDNVIMASDGCGGGEKFDGFSLSLTVADETEARRVFAALAEGGTITMPIDKTFWSPCFGMVKDRFGLNWMVTVPEPSLS